MSTDITTPDYRAFFDRFADLYRSALAGDLDVEQRNALFAPTAVTVGRQGFAASPSADLPLVMENPFGFGETPDLGDLRVVDLDHRPVARALDEVGVTYEAVVDGGPATGPITFRLVHIVWRGEDGPRIVITETDGLEAALASAASG